MLHSGKLERIIFNKGNFSILLINRIKVKINFSHNITLSEGMFLEVEGELQEDSKYGRTLICQKIKEIDEVKAPSKVLHMFISGIGEKKEDKIIEFLGPDYLEKLKNDPSLILDMHLCKASVSLLNQWESHKLQMSTLTKERLANYISSNFSGISNTKAQNWVSSIEEHGTGNLSEDMLSRRVIMRYLSNNTGNLIYEQLGSIDEIYHITSKLEELGYNEYIRNKLMQEFKFETLNNIYMNPYLPIKEKMNFEDCDNIAINKLGFEKDSIHRIVYGVAEILKRNELDGNTHMLKKEAIERSNILLSLDDFEYIESVIDMNLSYGDASEFVLHEDMLYRAPIYYTEKKIARILYEKAKHERNVVPKDISNAINTSFLVDCQKKAVSGLLQSKISILTGGPGTGKTTCIRLLCESISKIGKTFALASPTGRASKRMTESTGYEAKTIHRLLEYTGRGRFSYFAKNEDNKIDYDYVIIDESSMIDLFIMNNLLKAISDETTIIFIGDADQLPSIGTGSLLRDMKDSWVIPVYELDVVHRQGEGSYIIRNANCVKENNPLEIKERTDFMFNSIEDEMQAYDFIKKCIYLKKDFQILAPVKNGNYGTGKLNEIMQIILNPSNPSKKELFYNGQLFREGDKVIQLENNYDKDVFNGEMGVITNIGTDSIEVFYKDNMITTVKYKKKELKQLDLSYAISIHKSQGSEFDNVVMIADKRNKNFLSKELIYTGITRAKKGLVLLSTINVDDYANLHQSNDRATSISDFLKDIYIS